MVEKSGVKYSRFAQLWPTNRQFKIGTCHVRNRYFISVRFTRLGSEWVWFDLVWKMWFGSDISYSLL